MKPFVYFYFLKDEPEDLKKTVPEHWAYWHNKALSNYEGGAFKDNSGAMIIFDANDLQEAQEIVHEDPLVKQHLIHTRYLKEWVKN